MSQNQINERRRWKAETFPYDYYLTDPGIECTYCLTEKQAEILRGIVLPLGWTTRWWSDTGSVINQDDIQSFRDDIVRRLMMSCCGDEIPVQYRYSSTGVLQRSVDGGVTWEDAPEYDPRNNSPQFPPLTGDDGDDKKCIAATGAALLIEQQVGDQLTDDMSRYTLSQLINDWTQTYINTSNPFEALVTVIANQIFALVIATLRPALTSGVYDTLQCILYCQMSDDASFTDGQWAAVRSAILSQITGIAGIFLEHLVYLIGAGGLSNLARAGGSAAGDCGDCSCTDCQNFNFLTSDEGFVAGAILGNPGGEWTSGQGWVETYANTGDTNNNLVHIASPELMCDGNFDITLTWHVDIVYGEPFYSRLQIDGDVTETIPSPVAGTDYPITYFNKGLSPGNIMTVTGHSTACDFRLKSVTFSPA